MAFHDIVLVYTSTVGAGTITLGDAVAGNLTFALGGVVDGEGVYYGIADGDSNETGFGIYNSAGPTLTRDIIYASTNGGSAIDLSGTAQVFIPVVSSSLNKLVTEYNILAHSRFV